MFAIINQIITTAIVMGIAGWMMYTAGWIERIIYTLGTIVIGILYTWYDNRKHGITIHEMQLNLISVFGNFLYVTYHTAFVYIMVKLYLICSQFMIFWNCYNQHYQVSCVA